MLATLQELLDYDRQMLARKAAVRQRLHSRQDSDVSFSQPEVELEMPLIIQKSLDFLMEKGLNAEGNLQPFKKQFYASTQNSLALGLFRVPGAKEKLEKWQSKFNSGKGDTVDFLTQNEAPEDVASLLKQYLRDMPDKPLFTRDLEDQVLFIRKVRRVMEKISEG